MGAADWTVETWRCCRCKEDKAPTEFPIRVARGRPSYCKPCQREWGKAYRDRNREKLRADSKRWRLERIARGSNERHREYIKWLKHQFNITPSDYQAMFEAQGGVCGTCGSPPKEDRRLAIDHDRRCCSGKRSCGRCIRGLLCANCNMKLGAFELYAEQYLAWRDRRAV